VQSYTIFVIAQKANRDFFSNTDKRVLFLKLFGRNLETALQSSPNKYDGSGT
jgi:hypothetical protein